MPVSIPKKASAKLPTLGRLEVYAVPTGVDSADERRSQAILVTEANVQKYMKQSGAGELMSSAHQICENVGNTSKFADDDPIDWSADIAWPEVALNAAKEGWVMQGWEFTGGRCAGYQGISASTQQTRRKQLGKLALALSAARELSPSQFDELDALSRQTICDTVVIEIGGDNEPIETSLADLFVPLTEAGIRNKGNNKRVAGKGGNGDKKGGSGGCSGGCSGDSVADKGG